ncbi:MAG: hypothetical protein ABI895_14380 [Deltaproteobacteria bacterium]
MQNGFIGRAGALVFAATVAVVGCGSDDDGDGDGNGAAGAGGGGAATVTASGCTTNAGGTAVTSLCGAALLNSLTAAESTQLCDNTAAYVESSINRATGCKYVAIVAAASNSSPTEAQLQASCSSSEGTCNQDVSTDGAGAKTQCGTIPPTCTATVEQYSTCVVGEAALFEQGASALTSCSMLTFGNLSTVYDVPMAASESPSCMALKTACPNFTLPYIN